MSTALAEVVKPTLIEKPAPSLLPAFGGRDMAGALVAYRELQRALDESMPDQLIDIHGRPFRKKGYWRAIATAFNLSVGCVKEESDETGWRVVYRASTASGRNVEGDGSCDYDEKGEGQDSEHNVRSHAHTRAFNRAVSNLVGFGEVSAEEMTRERGGSRPAFVNVAAAIEAVASLPEPPPGHYYVHGYTLNGEWHEAYLLKYDSQGGSLKVSTKNPRGAKLKEAEAGKIPVSADVQMKPRTKGEAYLNGITLLGPAQDAF